MRKFLIIGAAAFMALGGLALSGGAQAAPVSVDLLAGSARTMAPIEQVQTRRTVRRTVRRPVYSYRNRGYRGYRGYGYGRSVTVLPRYYNPRTRGSSFGTGGRGDGGFIRGQQTQGITH
ncbi:MAG: hypothetical protein K2X62_17135 [Beijerinckiaceae bacterium]|jgi:hypothetical protein|nr:hypothetical protein [Beijerinckiaceae bacterium]MDO9441713.1 hypothetical protein [Beijerinckiaceae bacterium]